MSMKIKFDTSGNPETPVLVLSSQRGDNFGAIPYFTDLKITDNLKTASELYFKVLKTYDKEEFRYWDEIHNFRLIYVPDWDKYFVITLEINESNSIEKVITANSLQEVELGQLLLHNVEINTETDISREDYIRTVLYNPGEPKGSLLHRLVKDKASNYTILHVDDSIKNIQRSFSFDL
mgnify:FL=1